MMAVWQCKCPRCTKGAVFKYNTISFRFFDMYDACPVCGATYQPEPGFYFGAMFISYAFTVAIMVACSLFLWFFFNVSSTVYIMTFLGITVLFTPFSYRYSRMLWLHWLGGHKRLPK